MNFDILLMNALSKIEKPGDWRGEIWSGAHASGGICHPRTLPLRGRYNDYGSVQFLKSEQPVAKVIAAQLLDKAIDRQRKDYKMWPDLPKKPDLDVLAEIAERGALHMKGETAYGKIVPVGLWMVHERIYREMVEACRDWFKSSPYYGNGYEEKISRFIKANRDRAKLLQESRLMNKPVEFSTVDELNYMLETAMDLLPSQAEEGPKSIYNWASEHKVTDAQLDSIDEIFLDFVYFCQAMNSGRYYWQPVPGAGSQDGSVLFQQVVAKAVMEASENNDDRD